MSDTTTAAPAEEEPRVVPGATSEPHETPPPDQADGKDEPPPEDTPKDKEERRVAQVRARLGAAERALERQEQELEHYRRQVAQLQPQQETQEQAYARQMAEMEAKALTKVRAEMFHEYGRSQFTDWSQRCDDLIKMGADTGFAQLLVEMPDGVKVAAALAHEPAEVQRISGMSSERARAIALGKFAATLEGDAPAPRSPQVTKAPAPVRPVTGRASPQLNEYTADPNTLVDKYMRDNLERQRR